jgi:carbamoyltransferase
MENLMWIETPELSRNLPNLAIHGSHNASVVVEIGGEILEIIEFERFFNQKNLGYCQYMVAGSRRYAAELIMEYIENKYSIFQFGKVLHQHCESNDDVFTNEVQRYEYYKLFPANEYHEMKHHEAHAAGSFYQSPFQDAIAVSFDGGGNDGFFNIYRCNREKGLALIEKFDVDLGFPYMLFGEYIKDIRREPALSTGNLVYAGKILGYQSYGKCVPEWYDAFKEFYLAKPTGPTYEALLEILGEKIGLKFDGDNRFEDETAYNVAATSQKVFEDLFFEIAGMTLYKYQLPICLAGGCALNIVLNTRIRNELKLPVFVGPAPSDCGIATGMMLHCLKPTVQYDVSYLGIPAVDKYMLPREIENRRGNRVSIDCIVNDLYGDKIVGVVQHNSEHGPRALGNRSIICSPLNPNMKDILNAKVKDREFYRPFAPIVKLENVSEYFEWNESSEFMSFCPKVKDKYRDVLPSITHVDGTARVQTITRAKNPFIYDLLTIFEERTGVGVLINTSFNLNGKPILSSYADAFRVFDKTQMDCLYLDGFYFTK